MEAVMGGGRRWRIFYMSPELLMSLRFFGGQRDGDMVTLTKMDLPADVKVERVHYSPDRDAFGFIISHPSFDVVGEACVIPEMTVWCNAEQLRVVEDRPRGREFI